MEEFRRCFEGVPDPRTGNARRHELIEVLMISLCATLCGAESCVDMAQFGVAKEGTLRRFLRLEHGVPSHDTFSRLFRLLDPQAFHAAFQGFMEAFASARGEVIAIDGKSLRRSFESAASRSPLHLISAWANEEGLVLGQIKVDAGSNEIDAVPALLDLLCLEGRLVTLDAMHCQRETARRIVDAGADYLITVKTNQPRLHHDIKLWFDDPQAPVDDSATTVDGDHGRIETRTAEVLHDVEWLQQDHSWPGIRCVGRVVGEREVDGTASRSTRYYIASRSLSAPELNALARGHWGIENSLHWVLDVVMNEDQNRSRMDNAPENLALLRRLALSIIKKDKSKGSNRIKFKRAGWDDNFLINLIAQI